MITPTRTVCYAQFELDKTWHKVLSDEVDGLKVEVDHELITSTVLTYGSFSRIIVREEPIEQYRPWMVHDGDFSGLIIEPGEIRRYPSKCLCQKERMCNTCFQRFVAYNQATAWSLPSDEMLGRCKEPQS